MNGTTITLHAEDVSGQRAMEAKEVPVESSIGEVIQSILAQIQLPKNDTTGRELNYHARLEREGRYLHASERVGDALRDQDRIVLQPEIHAGCGRNA